MNHINLALKTLERYLLFFVIIFSSCNNSKNNLKDITNELAGCECRAISLRNERFQLADKIRFTQDTLMQLPADSVALHNRLTAMNNDKEILLLKSLRLADTIRKKTDFLLLNYFKDKSKEKEFYQLLDAVLKEKGCR